MKDTRDKILDTAEKLFSAKGVDTVSLREINTAAGVSQGVLHYHFGGRDGLLKAILERRLPALARERESMLAALSESGKEPTLQQMAEIIVLPLARLAIENRKGGRRFIKLLAHLNLEQNRIYQLESAKYSAPLEKQMGAWLMGRFPDVPLETLELRLTMALHAMYNTLAEVGTPGRAWFPRIDTKAPEPWQVVRTLVEFFAKGMQ
jgi:AcrR family transcriptional regulator